MIKLVLSDVDGTLIPLGAGTVSKRTMAAIAQVREAGVQFGLATGRDIVELMQLFEGNDLPFRTGILSNGKKIMVDGKIARLSLIENDGLQRLVQELAQYPHTFVTAYPFHTDASNPIYCMNTTEDELAEWAKTYAFKGIVVDKVPDEQIIGATIACSAGEDVLQQVYDSVIRCCPEFDVVKPAPRWWDILPKGLNKGTALHMLMDELGVTRDEVVMFGDADNDLAILTEVENSVVVSGATPATKDVAKYIIGACEDEAVAVALEDIASSTVNGVLPKFMRV